MSTVEDWTHGNYFDVTASLKVLLKRVNAMFVGRKLEEGSPCSRI